jgi:hypothetical protein
MFVALVAPTMQSVMFAVLTMLTDTSVGGVKK